MPSYVQHFLSNLLKIWYKRCPQQLSDCEFHENSHSEIQTFLGSVNECLYFPHSLSSYGVICCTWLAHNTLGHPMKVGMDKVVLLSWVLIILHLHVYHAPGILKVKNSWFLPGVHSENKFSNSACSWICVQAECKKLIEKVWKFVIPFITSCLKWKFQ